jgi:hypothetical protein
MKNLSEKFDRLPQDFDKEEIWAGIERPAKAPFSIRYLWVMVAIGIALPLSFLLIKSSGSGNESDHFKIAGTTDDLISVNEGQSALINERNDFSSESRTEDIESFQSSSHLVSVDGAGESFSSTFMQNVNNRSRNLEGEGIPLISEQQENADYSSDGNTPEDEKPHSAASGETDAYNAEPKPLEVLESEIAFDRKQYEYSHLPLSSLDILNQNWDFETPVLVSNKSEDAISGRHSLALRAGLGSHFTSFSSSEDDNLDLRKGLEQNQMDYSLGLRYEYELRKNFFLSFSAGYQLFKDWIQTSYIRKGTGEDPNVLIEYDLFNHYHTFLSRAEAGKRFIQKDFFWDLSAGMGIKFHQISDVDFFVDKGQLAEQAEVEAIYQSSVNAFFTGQAAIGRYFGSRHFMRAGVQFNSPIRLTDSNADVNHQIIPLNGFVEVGMRF